MKRLILINSLTFFGTVLITVGGLTSPALATPVYYFDSFLPPLFLVDGQKSEISLVESARRANSEKSGAIAEVIELSEKYKENLRAPIYDIDKNFPVKDKIHGIRLTLYERPFCKPGHKLLCFQRLLDTLLEEKVAFDFLRQNFCQSYFSPYLINLPCFCDAGEPTFDFFYPWPAKPTKKKKDDRTRFQGNVIRYYLPRLQVLHQKGRKSEDKPIFVNPVMRAELIEFDKSLDQQTTRGFCTPGQAQP